MGLYDTVPAYGLAQNNDMTDLELHGMSLNVRGSDFKTIVHAVAANENRYQFGRRSIYTDPMQAKSQNGVTQSNGKYRLEKGFLGAHSDIGGGYKDGDLSNASLMWMIKQAKEKGGIQFNDSLINQKEYDQINNPIVHDSVWSVPLLYTIGGQFRWANDNSKGFDKTSIFNNFEHLGLNWNDTKAFQNPNHKQFDEVEDITKLYLKSPDSWMFPIPNSKPLSTPLPLTKTVLNLPASNDQESDFT
ncbi:DUF2235 domain-containing protein (plasmid) [Moraxella bovis]|uniref:DUF2235 domain-containing protein n=1 Tax=Moraxella bovis TaxID=476 RepID=A0ABY6MB51_MORBO|nr:DUF2235 domain-containing protein [Moraxella bovis]UZA04828.1 DUF2235 domain-containing protein [Moraxella bovis]